MTTFADCKLSVFVAARDGNTRRLKIYLEQRSTAAVKELISTRTEGATPLVVACRNGHFEVAQYLIEKCHADLEQTGSVTFDGETIEGAPPLWCASAAGNMDIVKLLVSNGAKVNATTKTNSTPLRAACFDGHFAIVKYLVKQSADIEIANRHGHTCLMIACYKGHLDIAKYLISLGANVNRKSVKGNTALHDCAESGSLHIMKLLLNHGATIDVDSYGMTPLLAAAVTGHSHIVEYLISLDFIGAKERIEALELLGATYMDKKRDMMGAASLWRKALRERNWNALSKPTSQSPIPAFGGATEISTEAELDEVMSDPDSMRIQALIIRERILGPAHPDTSYFIRYRGAVYADAGNIPKCITLWLYALRMQQEILEPLSLMTQSSLSSFAELFSYILSKRISASVPKFVPDLVTVFNQALLEWKRGYDHVEQRKAGGFDVEKEALYLQRTYTISLHLACLLALCPPLVDEDLAAQIKKAIYQLLKLKMRGTSGTTPLHMAVSKKAAVVSRSPLCTFPSLNLTEILLELGADPNAVDDHGNTPLHIASVQPSLCQPSLITALLAKGAHYDSVNNTGMTFMDVYDAAKGLQRSGSSNNANNISAAANNNNNNASPPNSPSINALPPDADDQMNGQAGLEEPKCLSHIKPLQFINLQCLAARAINYHKVPYCSQDLPQVLINVVKSHGV